MTASSTRRRIVVTGAWSVPAVLVATAAPAVAASTTRTVTFAPGGTGVRTVPQPGGAVSYYDLVFSGATIRPSAAVAVGGLTLTVTLAQTTRQSPVLYVLAVPPGWTSSAAVETTADTVTFTYGGPVAAGQVLAFPDGDFASAAFEDTDPAGTGRYGVLVAVPGATATFTVATPGVAASKGPALTPRPRRPSRRSASAR